MSFRTISVNLFKTKIDFHKLSAPIEFSKCVVPLEPLEIAVVFSMYLI